MPLVAETTRAARCWAKAQLGAAQGCSFSLWESAARYNPPGQPVCLLLCMHLSNSLVYSRAVSCGATVQLLVVGTYGSRLELTFGQLAVGVDLRVARC